MEQNKSVHKGSIRKLIRMYEPKAKKAKLQAVRQTCILFVTLCDLRKLLPICYGTGQMRCTYRSSDKKDTCCFKSSGWSWLNLRYCKTQERRKSRSDRLR